MPSVTSVPPGANAKGGPCRTASSAAETASFQSGSYGSAPLRDKAVEGHPWQAWAEAEAQAGDQRLPGGGNRWNRAKDMSWEPLRAERVVEVSYDNLQGDRFRHATHFVRWRPDRDARSCTFEQLEVPHDYDLAEVLA